jgi:transcriptional regulator with XRE-family HTH domain
MLTEERISAFYKDVKRLGLKRPVAAITKATGYSKGNVSLYLSGKGQPSENFLDRFYEVFKESFKKVPSGILPEVPGKQEKEPEAKNSGSSDLSLQAIHNLTESGKKLASAHEIMASAQQTMATNEARLISLLENKSIVGDPKDTGVASAQVMRGILVGMAKIASGTRWHSEQEAIRELGRLIDEPVLGSKKGESIQTDGGKHSTG